MEGMIEVNGVNLWHRITGDGRARGSDPRRRFRPFQLRSRDPRALQALPRRRLRHAWLRPVGPTGAGLRHGGVGGRSRRPDGCARDRRGARPRNLDGRHDRDRLRRQVPRAHDVRGDQLRGCEARRHRTPDLQELDRHRAPGPGRSRQPPARRADHVAGPLEALPRGAGRDRADGSDSANPARLEPDRGVHGRLPGDVRHGPETVAAEDHVAGTCPRRRRGRDDALGSGAGRRRPAGDLRRHSERPRSTSSPARTTRRSSTGARSTTGS